MKFKGCGLCMQYRAKYKDFTLIGHFVIPSLSTYVHYVLAKGDLIG